MDSDDPRLADEEQWEDTLEEGLGMVRSRNKCIFTYKLDHEIKL